MSQIDDEDARRSAARVSAGVERYFLIFRAGPLVVFPIGGSVLFVVLALMLQTWWLLWGIPVMLAGLFCFGLAFRTRLPATRQVLDEGATDTGHGRSYVVWGWLLALGGFVGPIIGGPSVFGLF